MTTDEYNAIPKEERSDFFQQAAEAPQFENSGNQCSLDTKDYKNNSNLYQDKPHGELPLIKVCPGMVYRSAMFVCACMYLCDCHGVCVCVCVCVTLCCLFVRTRQWIFWSGGL